MLDLQKITEVLVVGNAPTEHSFAELTETHPCVVRFNKGANPLILEKTKLITGVKTHIHCLSGYGGGDFGPIKGFEGGKILWSRPYDDGQHAYGLYVFKNILDAVTKVTPTQCCIPRECFKNFAKEYGIINPSTGTITVYFFKKLGINVKLVNFPLKNGLPNIHGGGGVNCVHPVDKEREALNHLLGLNHNNHISAV